MSLLSLVLTTVSWVGAGATENGVTHIDLGFSDQLVAYPPPPGFYFRNDVEYITSNELDNHLGKPVSLNTGALGQIPIKFYSSITAEILTFIYVPDFKILGASLTSAAYTAYAFSRTEVQTNILGRFSGSGETRRGLSDFFVVPVIFSWLIPRADLSIGVAPFNFVAPAGQYNHDDPNGNNIGLNYWSARPGGALTYLNKGGQEADLYIAFSINAQNNATKYKSGAEFGTTYTFEQHLNQHLALGVEGYFYDQLSDDRLNGTITNTVAATPGGVVDPLDQGAGTRGQTFAVGPVINYVVNRHFFLNAHFEHQIYAVDRARQEVLWLRGSIAF